MSKRRKTDEPSVRDKLSADFLEAFAADFKQNGVAVITAMREESPSKYVETAARLIPQEPVASDAFTGAQSEQEIGRRLLLQVGTPEDGLTEEAIEQAAQANAAFIDTLLGIKTRSMNGGNA
jgi:hypothetical protein